LRDERSKSNQRPSTGLSRTSAAEVVVLTLAALRPARKDQPLSSSLRIVVISAVCVDSTGGIRATARPQGGGRRPAERELRCLQQPGRVALAALRGRPTVANPWASWCRPCDRGAAVAGRAPSVGARVRFLGVDVRDDPRAARAFLADFGLTYPQVTDAAGRLPGPLGSPASRTGEISAEALDGALDRPAVASYEISGTGQ